MSNARKTEAWLADRDAEPLQAGIESQGAMLIATSLEGFKLCLQCFEHIRILFQDLIVEGR